MGKYDYIESGNSGVGGRTAGPTTPINNNKGIGSAPKYDYVPPGGTANAPVYQPRQPAYQPPPVYQQPVYNPPPATPSFGIGAPTTGGYGGAPAPAPQAKPVISEGDWLAGDSEYQDQLTQYGTALTDFLARLTKQKTDFTQDYEVAKQGLDRNEANGLQNLGEDFTSRGLANSGLFADSRRKAQENFTNQRTGMTTARDRALSDFTSQETDKRNSTKMAQDNAKKSSLSRLAMNQQF